MALKFSDFLIVSDVDGTLVVSNDPQPPLPIPTRNLEALKRFTDAGGHFAIASGRAISSARRFVEQLPVNAPCILYNGSGIYDYESKQMLFSYNLPETSKEYVKVIIERFPEIGVVFMDAWDMHSVSAFDFVESHLMMEGMPCIQETPDMVKGAYLKVIMAMPEELTAEVTDFCSSQGWKDVSFVRSGAPFVEMLPADVHKGSGISVLSNALQIPIERIAAIGDFYNDIGMLRSVGFPVTVAEAPDEIKSICKLVTGPCEFGALADLVEALEARYPA